MIIRKEFWVRGKIFTVGLTQSQLSALVHACQRISSHYVDRDLLGLPHFNFNDSDIVLAEEKESGEVVVTQGAIKFSVKVFGYGISNTLSRQILIIAKEFNVKAKVESVTNFFVN